MSILWSEFTPWASLAGGLLIGLSAAMLIALLGRIAGISGIAGALLQTPTWAALQHWGWRLAFVLGLFAAPLIWKLFAPLPKMHMPSNPLVIVVAGLLVGVGLRLGGCLDDRQPQSGTAGPAAPGLVQPDEAVEDDLPILRRNPRAVVVHPDDRGRPRHGQLQPDPALASRSGVVGQVSHQSSQRGLVAADPRWNRPHQNLEGGFGP